MAAAARAAHARDERSGGVRGWRRAGSLHQTRRIRRRGGLDGGVAHPRVSGRGMSHPSVAELRPIDLFAELSEDELETWCEAAETREIPAGTVMAKQGETKTGLVLVLEGTIEALVRDGTGDEPIGDHVAPTWMGAIPTLVGGPSAVRMVARGNVRVGVIEAERFVDLILGHRTVFP